MNSAGKGLSAFVCCIFILGCIFLSAAIFLAFCLCRLVVFFVNLFLILFESLYHFVTVMAITSRKHGSCNAEGKNSNKCCMCNLHKLGLSQLVMSYWVSLFEHA